MKLYVSSTHAGKRLDKFLQEQLPEYSRTRLQAWIKEGRVQVSGRSEKPSYVLKGGEWVEVEPAPPEPLKAEPEAIELEVLYEDDDLAVVNKPAGMVVHSGAGCRRGTLVNAMLYRFGSLSTVGGELRPGIVHRLDRFTSGAIVVAKNDSAHRNLAQQFARRQVDKTYLALVHGCVKQDEGRIDRPIARDPKQRVRMTARLGSGRAALTEYRVLRRFQGFTLVEVHLRTGRTHQVRVHLASIGHPVVGDPLYGAPRRVEGMPELGRYFLHAWKLSFSHPSKGERITVEAPLPSELEAWLKRLL